MVGKPAFQVIDDFGCERWAVVLLGVEFRELHWRRSRMLSSQLLDGFDAIDGGRKGDGYRGHTGWHDAAVRIGWAWGRGAWRVRGGGRTGVLAQIPAHCGERDGEVVETQEFGDLGESAASCAQFENVCVKRR